MMMTRMALMVAVAAVAAEAATNTPPAVAKPPAPGITVAESKRTSPPASLRQKMAALTLPDMVFRNAPVSEILQWIMDKSAEVDPEKTGVNIIIKDDTDRYMAKRRLTMTLKAPTVDQALKLLASTAGLYVRVDERVIVVERSTNVTK